MAGENLRPTGGVKPVHGFAVKKINILPGKNEEDIGSIQFVLEAPKDDVRAQDMDLNSILGALNMHQSTREAVAVQLRFN